MINELEISEATTQTGRMSGDERRSQILRVAIELFSQNGFSGTTTKEIARVAGVSEAMVFRHFATKQELYAAILDYKACGGEVLKPLARIADFIQAKDDYGVFYNLALGAFKHHEEDQVFLRLFMYSALEGHELAEMFFDRFVAKMYDFLSAYIRERQKDGVFREVEPKVIVRAFVGMMIHHSLNNILWDKSRRLLNISNEEAANAFAEILLRGVLKEKQ